MTRRRTTVLAISLVSLAFFNLGCFGIDWFGDDIPPDQHEVEQMERDREAEEEALAAQQAALSAEEQAAPEATDSIVKIRLAGENLPYHTGLLYNTPFYLIRTGQGTATASGSKSFEEQFAVQTSRGTDTVSFDGEYDVGYEVVTGTLTIRTQSRVTGEDSYSDNTLTYEFTGQLRMERTDYRSIDWTGTVTGTSTLRQQWDNGDPDDVTTHNVSWTIADTDHRDLTDYNE